MTLSGGPCCSYTTALDGGDKVVEKARTLRVWDRRRTASFRVTLQSGFNALRVADRTRDAIFQSRDRPLSSNPGSFEKLKRVMGISQSWALVETDARD